MLNDKSPVCGEQRLERKWIWRDLEKKEKKKKGKGVEGYINEGELKGTRVSEIPWHVKSVMPSLLRR